MTFQEAIATFKVAGLDPDDLQGQEEAFKLCVDFLDGVSKIKSQNRNHTSYGLKHIVENPSGRFGDISRSDAYSRYVYEGTFVLAALASGFTMRQRGRHLKGTFNMSELGLRKRAKQITLQRTEQGAAANP